MILWHIGTTIAILWFVFRGNTRVDYRFAALGALLPDLIDKPIGRILLRGRFETGRLWGHTLLVNVAFFCILFFMRGRVKRRLVMLPTGSLLHIAEDGMWSIPQTFWWPLFGTEFPPHPLPYGLLGYFNPFRNPGLYLQELVGALLLAWLLSAHGMLSRDGIRTFVRTGRLEMQRA
ncbi:MAG TPA: metal-dependent hydrolase [Actinomycetota bacterium]|nr:metal-dependent hydrolase [Actinomycetota bacterium]